MIPHLSVGNALSYRLDDGLMVVGEVGIEPT